MVRVRGTRNRAMWTRRRCGCSTRRRRGRWWSGCSSPAGSCASCPSPSAGSAAYSRSTCRATSSRFTSWETGSICCPGHIDMRITAMLQSEKHIILLIQLGTSESNGISSSGLQMTMFNSKKTLLVVWNAHCGDGI